MQGGPAASAFLAWKAEDKVLKGITGAVAVLLPLILAKGLFVHLPGLFRAPKVEQRVHRTGVAELACILGLIYTIVKLEKPAEEALARGVTAATLKAYKSAQLHKVGVFVVSVVVKVANFNAQADLATAAVSDEKKAQ